MSEFATKLKQLRTSKNLTQESLGNSLGVSKSIISMYETGKRKPSFEMLEALADFFNVDMNLLTGRNDNSHLSLFPVDFKKTVPVLGRISAGAPIIANENIEYYVRVENENIDFGLIVSGESMYPTILPSSTIFIQKDAEINNGSIVVAVVNGDEATVKRLYLYGDKIMLRPDNINYPEQEYPADEVYVLGRVVEMRVSLV